MQLHAETGNKETGGNRGQTGKPGNRGQTGRFLILEPIPVVLLEHPEQQFFGLSKTQRTAPIVSP